MTLLSWSAQQELQAQATVPGFSVLLFELLRCSVLCSELGAVYPFTGFYLGQLSSFLFSCVFLTVFPHRCLLVLCFSPHLSGIIFRSFFFSELFPHVICLWSCIFCFSYVLFFVFFSGCLDPVCDKGVSVTWVLPCCSEGLCSSIASPDTHRAATRKVVTTPPRRITVGLKGSEQGRELKPSLVTREHLLTYI